MMSLRDQSSGLRWICMLVLVGMALSAPVAAQVLPDLEDVEPGRSPNEEPIDVYDPGAGDDVRPEEDAPEEEEDEKAAYENLDTITVTANRREENLQEAAISVTALEGSFIEEVGLTNFNEIQKFTPNLQIVPQSDSRSTSIRIRGIGSVGSNAGIDPSVAVFIDGIYQGRAGMSVQDLMDVEAVEVLRGPQGTLYGKNTAAGAIVVRTRKPNYETSGMLEFVGGNYKNVEGRFTGNIPLIEDVLATRLTGYGVTRDGFEINSAPEHDGDRINGTTRWGLRSSTVWDATDNLSFLLIGDYSERQENCCAGDVIRYGTQTPIQFVLPPASIVSQYQNIPLPEAVPGDRIVDVNVTPNNFVQVGGLSLDIELDQWEHTFNLLTAWRTYKSDSLYDGDFSRLDAIKWNTDVALNQISTELRVASPPFEYLDYVGGLYFYYSDLKTEDELEMTEAYFINKPGVYGCGPNRPIPTVCVPPLFQKNMGNNTHETTSLAGYGDVNINVSELWGGEPAITFTGGIRVGWERKANIGTQKSRGIMMANCTWNADNTVIIDCGPLDTAVSGPDGFSDQHEDDTYVTGRAILKWQINEDLMTYASYATGYKSGGYNQLRTSGATGEGGNEDNLWFEPETSDSIELGFRTTWLDQMVTFNITGFYTNYNDFQTQVFDGFGIRIDNAANFISTGFESDITIVPLEGWINVFSVGYTYTEYKDFERGPCTRDQGLAQRVNCTQDLSGRRLDGVPNWNLSLFSSYEDEVPATDLYWYTQMSFNYQTWRYLNASLDPKLKADPFAQLGFRVGLRHAEGIWDLSFWVKNVTDDNFWVIGFDIPTMDGYAGFLAPPRTFGGTLRVKF